MNILQINTGIHGRSSKSSILADKILNELGESHSIENHLVRDISLASIPHIDADSFKSFADPICEEKPTLSDVLVKEVMNSDVLVLGVPMYNLGIPSTLKAWIDHIARPRITFRYTENGVEGLLKNKTAIIAAARGGVYQGTDKDVQSIYVKQVLNFLGFENIYFVYAEGMAFGEEQVNKSMASAEQEIKRVSALISNH
ncbi:FMN-dependent NADH-azoreductase [Parashewanella tropica]|uniref:FMN-dependent NADH-azoreductase n=1 Tax=Parashewanella tropica TaxID=2547970 RepID=UPI00105A7CCE|nr:NAD(P)H-dependent oxidoreductase [Parashewanella tropica]